MRKVLSFDLSPMENLFAILGVKFEKFKPGPSKTQSLKLKRILITAFKMILEQT